MWYWQKVQTVTFEKLLDRAKRLSSTSNFFFHECNSLNGIFLKVKYPEKLINSTIHNFQHPSDPSQRPSDRSPDSPIRIIISFKDQKSADVVRDGLRGTELKPPAVSQ